MSDYEKQLAHHKRLLEMRNDPNYVESGVEEEVVIPEGKPKEKLSKWTYIFLSICLVGLILIGVAIYFIIKHLDVIIFWLVALTILYVAYKGMTYSDGNNSTQEKNIGSCRNFGNGVIITLENEKGKQVGDFYRDGKLYGYNSSSVTLDNNGVLYTYDTNGKNTGTRFNN